jgi:D-sedoheptulose 7-phosphate isomerase
MAIESHQVETQLATDLATSFQAASSKQEYARQYLRYFSHILTQLDVRVIEQIIEAIEEAAGRGSTIFLIGNGGSAANASHMANDLAFGASLDGFPPFRVFCLTDNVPIMTAVANDMNYSQIFVRQLHTLLQPKDVVIALSVSGNSPNVVEAVRFAKERDAITIGCGGFDGGELSREADIYLHVPTKSGEYGPVEDVMMVLDHLIHSYFVLSRRGTLER